MFISSRKIRKGGFTLIELLIVIAIIGSLGLVSFPVYSHFSNKTYSRSSMLEIENLLKRTRQKSFSSLNDSSFGAYLDVVANKFVFYKGNSFQTRVLNEDFEISFNSSLELVSPAENTDINFLLGSGTPDNEVVFLFSPEGANEKSIRINKFGAIFIE